MTKHLIARRKQLIYLLALAAVAVIGAVFIARPVGDWALAGYYRQRLDVAEGREARVVLSQAADLGEAGIAVLVDGLGSERAVVSRAAVEVIRQRMEEWESLRPRYSSPLLGRLAIELSDAVEQFDAAAEAEAARIAEEILTRRLDRYAVDRCRVTLACQEVIRAADLSVASRPSRGKADVDIGPDDRSSADAMARENSGVTNVPVAQLAALPGGGLPQTSQPVLEGGRLEEQMHRLTHRFDPRDLQNADAETPAERVAGDEPRWFNMPKVIRPLGESNPSNGAMRLTKPLGGPAREVQPGPRVSKDMSKKGPSGKRLSDAKTVDLLRRLNQGNAQTMAATRNELRLRGFKDVHFRAAAELFDPNPAVRTRLARELIGVPGLNPQPWLLVLARDTNSDVRLTAITLLSTAADPSVLAEVESIARQDADQRVRQQAERIAERQARR